MDFILGQPWLRAVEPAIDWGIQRVLWEQDGDVVSMFGRKAPPRDISGGTAAAVEVEVVSTKRFCHDIDVEWCVLLCRGWACCHRRRALARQLQPRLQTLRALQ